MSASVRSASEKSHPEASILCILALASFALVSTAFYILAPAKLALLRSAFLKIPPAGKVCAFQVSLSQSCAGEIAAGEFCIGQVGPFEVGLGQVSFSSLICEAMLQDMSALAKKFPLKWPLDRSDEARMAFEKLAFVNAALVSRGPRDNGSGKIGCRENGAFHNRFSQVCSEEVGFGEICLYEGGPGEISLGKIDSCQ